MVKLNQNGFTLLETVLAVGITASVIFLIVEAVDVAVKRGKAQSDAIELDLSMAQAQKLIRRLGRVANKCAAVSTTPLESLLECDVDFANPPSGILTKIRFKVSGKHLVYEHLDSITGTWKTKLRYPAVEGFTVCSTAMLAAGTCELKPKIEKLANLTNNRFFRYELKAIDSKDGKPGRKYSGAFYVRHPTPFGPQIVYQWGAE